MKKKYILLSVLLFSLFSLNALAGDRGSSNKRDTYKLKIKHVVQDTEIVATCDNGYYKKKKADEDKIKFKLPKHTNCSLHVSVKEPCDTEFDIVLDGEDKIYLDNYYSCDNIPTPPPSPTPNPTTPPSPTPTPTTPPMTGE